MEKAGELKEDKNNIESEVIRRQGRKLMFGKRFQLDENTLPIVEEIGKHMPGGFFIYKDSGEEELLYINEAAMNIFGCSSLDEFQELTGYTFRGMVHPDDYDAITGVINEQIAPNEEGYDYVEYRIIRRDGSVRWVEDYGHHTKTDTYGGIYYVFISDITEKKERMEEDIVRRQQEAREEELLRQLALNEQLLEKEKQRAELDKMITAMASDYRSVYYVDLDADDAVCYRADPEDAKQTPEGEHFPFYDRFRYYCDLYVDDGYRDGYLEFIEPDNIRKALSDENIIAYRYLTHRGGHDVYEMLRMAGVRHPADRDDHIVHAVGVGFTVIDAEMRRQIEYTQTLKEALSAAEEANSAKTTFLSNMSHEIRTPMNAIIGLNTIALENPDLPNVTREQLEQIGVSAHYLLNIINDVLDMSRIESGKMTLNLHDFSFSELLEQVDTIIGEQCREKDISYESRITGRMAEYYKGDEMKLRQILINILGNAVKFTPRGGSVVLTCEETASLKGNATIRFVMSDTGIGMSSEFLPRIFDTFSQEKTSSSNSYGSTGLGMAITKNFVELMNGSIDVESEKNVGTVFTVTVPLRRSALMTSAEKSAQKKSALQHSELHNDGIAGSEKKIKKQKAELNGRRLLLAEDVEVNAQIMMMVLEARGITAELAVNGKIAVQMFKSNEPGYYDAILMDMRMPEMDGLTATKEIRKSGKADAETIPIIALTANAFDEDVQRSLQAGLNAHLAKPVEPDTLYGALETLIKE